MSADQLYDSRPGAKAKSWSSCLEGPGVGPCAREQLRRCTRSCTRLLCVAVEVKQLFNPKSGPSRSGFMHIVHLSRDIRCAARSGHLLKRAFRQERTDVWSLEALFSQLTDIRALTSKRLGPEDLD